jgi:hypothetical protein
VKWALERDHLPFANGILTFERGAGTFVPDRGLEPILGAQARAYVDSYLRRLREKGE